MLTPKDAERKIAINDFPEYEKRFPDLSELYSHLKDKYVKLKLEYIKQRKENRKLKKSNDLLSIHAYESEKMLNERIFNQVKQTPGDEEI